MIDFEQSLRFMSVIIIDRIALILTTICVYINWVSSFLFEFFHIIMIIYTTGDSQTVQKQK